MTEAQAANGLEQKMEGNVVSRTLGTTLLFTGRNDICNGVSSNNLVNMSVFLYVAAYYNRMMQKLISGENGSVEVLTDEA
jgi:hypothetical protein